MEKKRIKLKNPNMATKKAISAVCLLPRFVLTTLVTVVEFSDEDMDFVALALHSSSVISPLDTTIQSVAVIPIIPNWIYKRRSSIHNPNHTQFALFSSATKFPLRFYKILSIMADNIRRALQDLDLGVNDAPIALPLDVVNQAAAANRFIIMGRPVIPRRQNLRSVVAAMPRLWGLAGLVHGRILEGRRFQFVFPSEESMDNVLRRGPWAFAERMLVLQRWTPVMNLEMLNYIPFWIQIRGIPLQFLNQEIVAHIGRALGQLMDVDYIEMAAAQVE